MRVYISCPLALIEVCDKDLWCIAIFRQLAECSLRHADDHSPRSPTCHHALFHYYAC